MASRTRIDDERMTKLKPTEDGGFLKSTYSVKEREIMMGLPQGYVSKAMKELFREIALNGFLRPESNLGKTYKVRKLISIAYSLLQFLTFRPASNSPILIAHYGTL